MKSITKAVKNEARGPSVPVFIPIILLLGFAGLTLLVLTNKTEGFDDYVENFITSWNIRGFRTGFRILTNALTIILFLGAGIVFFLVKKLPLAAVFLFVAAGGGYIISSTLKVVFDRIGPHGLLNAEIGYSYPSGHATVTISFLGLLLFLGLGTLKANRVKQLYAAGLIFLLLLVGVGMVYLRYHYLTDIIGGWLIGGCYLSMLLAIYRFLAPFIFSKNKQAVQVNRK